MMTADEVKISQVIYNFLSNAFKHTPDGKKITIRAFEKNDWIQVEVEDEGEGIKKEDLPYIWDRYYKIDKKYQRATGGSTGLGLAIVKAIVSAHQGEIEVDSEVGCGSQFVIRLPVRSDAADHPLPAEHSPHLPEPSPQNTNAGASS